MRTCRQCVLDERFPGIAFDEHDVCSLCRSRPAENTLEQQRQEYDLRFRELIEEHRNRGAYDCLVAYSGGKDSTYTLHLLKERYDVRVLAFSFDNWYQSEAALANIRSVIKKLAVDHLTVMPSFETMKGIIRASLGSELHGAKALVRASGICTSCISIIRGVAFRMAIDQGIPFVVFGMSPGQAPLPTSIVKTNPKLFRVAQTSLLERLRGLVGPEVQTLFLTDRHYAAEARFPHSVNPLAFVEYDESVIYDVIARYGWEKPADTDPNSSNCLLNAVANQAHIREFGYNPYTYEVAELVRSGRMTRDEGLRRLQADQDSERVASILQELGIDWD